MSRRFDARALLQCYARGVFPMAESRDDPSLFLLDPTDRGVMPLDGLHVSRSLRKSMRRDDHAVVFDQDFPAVVRACAEPALGREETWISPVIESLYRELHEAGFAHSVEVRDFREDPEGELVGGLYGVALRGAFFGESMFSRRTDASKIALVSLVGRLNARGYRLLDMQFLTPHLASLGGVEIPRAEYRRRLAEALEVEASWE